MTALTPTTFRARYPEFADTTAFPDARVEAALEDATELVNEDLWGDLLNRAVGLLAAHDLSVSPFGLPVQPGSKGERSSYLAEHDRLALRLAGGPWVIGQRADGAFPGVTITEDE